MQTRFLPRGVLALAAGTTLALFVRAADETPAAQITFIDPSSAEGRSYRGPGEYAIDRLVMTMITDSAGAVARHTEVAALETFHLKDVPKKNGTVAGLPRITDLKFTSLKLRNPNNAPDAAEKLALAAVNVGLQRGEPPEVLVQKIEQPGKPVEWRVYKPLANIRQCGTCHGIPDEMSPELREALQKKYPEDNATGFVVGQWRGLIRVTVGEPPPPPAPKPAPAPAKSTKPAKRG
jgi:hypothetical protein